MNRAAAAGDALRRALELARAGRLDEADGSCQRVLDQSPGDFNAQQLRGVIALQRRDWTGALRWLQGAVAANPAVAAVHSNLAVALLALGRPAEARDCARRALALQPRYPQADLNLGHAQAALGCDAEAVAAYERTLSQAPAQPDALAGLGAALMRLGRATDALTAFDAALRLTPQSPELHSNRGTALRNLGRLQEAVRCFERALQLRPDFAVAFCNLANVALDTERPADALRLGDRALALLPDMPDALNIRGTALRVMKRHEEAVQTYDRLVRLAPGFGHAASHLLFERNSLCDWQGWADGVAGIVARIRAGESASTPHVFLGLSDSAALQLSCARAFAARQFTSTPPLWRGEAYAHPRLRVAYLSADFSDHPVAHLIAGVLERHDRGRFETVGVALRGAADTDPLRARLQAAFDHFVDATLLSDADAARRLRALEIDIAVDLTGHTRDGRLGILMHRPAPIQIQYLGYAGTSGADFIDYTLADRITVPPGDERFFSEQVVRLPHTFLPNDDRQPVAAATPTRASLGLPDGGIVFCALHNPYKLNPPLFDTWMSILRETPGSVLWLRGGSQTLVGNLQREAAMRGIGADRLVFAGRVPGMPEHLARYRQADLFLDAVPYGGHATARDALWAGLPVLTCAGAGLASRVAASLLHALGLPELVTGSLGEYERRALQLARDPGRLTGLRARLASQRTASPALATDVYRASLEAAYLGLWERQRQGLAPAGMDLTAP